MKEETIKEGIKKLQLAYHYNLLSGSTKMWAEEINQAGITEEEFQIGISTALESRLVMPTLPILLGLCRQVRAERLETAQIEEREINRQISRKFWQGGDTNIGKDTIKLIEKILSNLITKTEVIAEMVRLDGVYPQAGWMEQANHPFWQDTQG